MDLRNMRIGRMLFVSAVAFVASGIVGPSARQAQACPVGGCTNASFYGDYAISSSTNGSLSTHFGGIGVLHADGAGGVTGSQTLASDSTTPVSVFTLYYCNGTYSINSDGTGTMLVYVESSALCTDEDPPTTTLAIVLEDGGHALRFVNTNQGGVAVGSGRLQ